MSNSLLKSASRTLFRWYLSKFPLRDGKAYFYEKLHPHLMPGERLLTVTLDQGFRMRLDLEDAEQRKVYFFGHYHERYEAALVARLLDPGEVFWDVGANVGYFSLVAAAAVGETGEVVAFEPGAASLERLTENVSLNPDQNIRIFNLAVAEADRRSHALPRRRHRRQQRQPVQRRGRGRRWARSAAPWPWTAGSNRKACGRRTFSSWTWKGRNWRPCKGRRAS